MRISWGSQNVDIHADRTPMESTGCNKSSVWWGKCGELGILVVVVLNMHGISVCMLAY